MFDENEHDWYIAGELTLHIQMSHIVCSNQQELA